MGKQFLEQQTKKEPKKKQGCIHLSRQDPQIS